MSLARVAALNNFDLDDAWDKAQRCARFEVDFDSRITDTDGWTAPDGRTYDLDALWRVRSLDLAIDITALGSKELSGGILLRGAQHLSVWRGCCALALLRPAGWGRPPAP